MAIPIMFVEGRERDAIEVFITDRKYDRDAVKVYVTNNKHERGLIKGKIVDRERDAQMTVYICKNKWE